MRSPSPHSLDDKPGHWARLQLLLGRLRCGPLHCESLLGHPHREGAATRAEGRGADRNRAQVVVNGEADIGGLETEVARPSNADNYTRLATGRLPLGRLEAEEQHLIVESWLKCGCNGLLMDGIHYENPARPAACMNGSPDRAPSRSFWSAYFRPALVVALFAAGGAARWIGPADGGCSVWVPGGGVPVPGSAPVRGGARVALPQDGRSPGQQRPAARPAAAALPRQLRRAALRPAHPAARRPPGGQTPPESPALSGPAPPL